MAKYFADYEKDIARMVLNYLHQQHLFDAYRAFCSTSPHLVGTWQRIQQTNCAPYALFRPIGQSLHDLLRLHNTIENYALDLPPDKGARLAALETSEQRLCAILRAVDEQKLRCIKRRHTSQQPQPNEFAAEPTADNNNGAAANAEDGGEEDDVDFNTPTEATQRRGGLQHAALANASAAAAGAGHRRIIGAAAAIHSFATSTACVPAVSASKRQRLSLLHPSHSRHDERMPSPIVDTSATTTTTTTTTPMASTSGATATRDDENRTPTSVSGATQPTVLAKKLLAAQQRSQAKKPPHPATLPPVEAPDAQPPPQHAPEISGLGQHTAAPVVLQAGAVSALLPPDYDAMILDLDSLLESTCFHQVLADSINNVLHTPNKEAEEAAAADGAAEANAHVDAIDSVALLALNHAASVGPAAAAGSLKDQLNSDAMNAIVNTATGDPSFQHLVENMVHSNLAPDALTVDAPPADQEAAAATDAETAEKVEPFRSRLRARRESTQPRTCYMVDGPKRPYTRRSASKSTAATAAATATAARDLSSESTVSVRVLSNETYDGRLGSAEQMLSEMQQQQQQLQQRQHEQQRPGVADVESAAPESTPVAIIAPPPPGHFYAVPASSVDDVVLENGADGTAQPAQLISVSSAGVQRYVLLSNWGVIDGVSGSLETGTIIDVSNNIHSSAEPAAATATAAALETAEPAVDAVAGPPDRSGTLNHSSDKENSAAQPAAPQALFLSAAPTASTDTPSVVPNQLQMLKSKALSTPRRHSHVRVLDFNTPAPNATSAEAAASAPATGAPDAPASAPPKFAMQQQQQASKSSSGDDAKDNNGSEATTAAVASTRQRIRVRKMSTSASRAATATSKVPEAVDAESLPIAPMAKAKAKAQQKRKTVSTKSTNDASVSNEQAHVPNESASSAAEATAPHTEADLEAWQQLRSIKNNDWDNHMRKQCANMPIKRLPRAPPKRKRRANASKVAPAAAAAAPDSGANETAAAGKPQANESLNSTIATHSPDTSLTSAHGDMLAAALNQSGDSVATLNAIAEESETDEPADGDDAAAVAAKTEASKTPRKTERFSIKLPPSSKKKTPAATAADAAVASAVATAAAATPLLHTPPKIDPPTVGTAPAEPIASATSSDAPASGGPHNISDHTDDGHCTTSGDTSAVPPTPRLTLAALDAGDSTGNSAGTAARFQPVARCDSAASVGDMSELRYGDSDACQTPTNGGFPKTPGVGATTPSPVYSPRGEEAMSQREANGGGGSSYYRPDESDTVIIPKAAEQSASGDDGELVNLPPSGEPHSETTDAANEQRPAADEAEKYNNNNNNNSSSSSSASTSSGSSSCESSTSSGSSSASSSSRPPSVVFDLNHRLPCDEDIEPHDDPEAGQQQMQLYAEQIYERQCLHREIHRAHEAEQRRLLHEQQAADAERQRQEDAAAAEAAAAAAAVDAQAAADRRYAAQVAQAAQLAEARERTKNRLKVERTRESFKTQQATLAHRKQKLAQRQGFAAAVAAAAQQRPLAAASASVQVVVPHKTPSVVVEAGTASRQKSAEQKPSVPSGSSPPEALATKPAPERRKTICLDALPVAAASGRGAGRPSLLRAGKKTAKASSSSNGNGNGGAERQRSSDDMPWKSPEFHGFNATEAAANDESSDGEAFRKATQSGRPRRLKKKNPAQRLEDNDEDNEEADVSPTTTPIVAATKPDTQQRELPPPPPDQPSYTSSYATATTSNHHDAVAAAGGYKAQARELFGDAIDSDFMETPMKASPDDAAAGNAPSPRLSDVLPALNLMATPPKTSTPNEDVQHKRATNEPLGSAAAAIEFGKPPPMSAIKMPAKKRKDVAAIGRPSVQPNPMLAALETPVKPGAGLLAQQPPSSAETRAAVASLNITPLRVDGGADADVSDERGLEVERSQAERVQDEKGGDVEPDEEGDDDDDDEEEIDAYEECTLLRANEVRRNVGYAEYRFKDDGRTVRSRATAPAKITTMDVRLEDITVRLRATDAMVMFAQAPSKPSLPPPPPAPAASKKSSTSGTSSARVHKASSSSSATSKRATPAATAAAAANSNDPSRSSAPLIVPRVRVSYKGTAPVHAKQTPAATVPTPANTATAAATTAEETSQKGGNLKEDATTVTTKNLRAFDVNLVLGKVHPT